MRLAIDAMGGDHAPAMPVRATCQFAADHKDVSFILVGREPEIMRHVNGALPGNVSVVNASEVIETGEEPARAVRRKQDSSLVKAALLVRDGDCDVMLSAGNTGALVAAGLLVIGRMKSIHRPALAPVLPTFAGHGVLLLDAGATMDASPENLLQFAQMGSIYSEYVLNVTNPRVGLLNIGTEEGKGNALAKDAFKLLQGAQLNFLGNLEARELLSGECDVVVCDGFVGNVVLKLIEGVGQGVFAELRNTLTAGFLSKLAAAVLKPSLAGFRRRFDYVEYGGAPFLGVKGGCIKAHGSSKERAWITTLQQAVTFSRQDLQGKIETQLQKSGFTEEI